MTAAQKSRQRANALSRRAQREAAHQRQMDQHAAMRAAFAAYERAYDAWVDADCIGPKPIDPRCCPQAVAA